MCIFIFSPVRSAIGNVTTVLFKVQQRALTTLYFDAATVFLAPIFHNEDHYVYAAFSLCGLCVGGSIFSQCDGRGPVIYAPAPCDDEDVAMRSVKTAMIHHSHRESHIGLSLSAGPWINNRRLRLGSKTVLAADKSGQGAGGQPLNTKN